MKVRVVGLTPETVLAANTQGFAPRSLPGAFGATAGVGGTVMGTGALPESQISPQDRPGALTTDVPPPVPAQPYRIGVGDVVILATKQGASTAAELTGLLAAQQRRQGYTVQDDGAIAVPDVGRVRIADMTLEEAESELFQRLLARQIDPSFSLEVAEFNSRKVAIGGAVAKPGVAPITLTAMTLDGALAAAGGPTAADQESTTIRIYREGELYQIPLAEFYRQPSLQKVRLTDGDSVFVDTGYDLNLAQAYFAEQIQLATFRRTDRVNALQSLDLEVGLRRAELTEQRAAFKDQVALDAVDRDYVYLTGEVEKQNRWPLPFNQQASLADALYDAGGGISPGTGNPRQVYVLRSSPDPRDFGGVTAWHLDAGNAGKLVLATRFELRPDDVIFISEQPVTKWNRVVQQITPSLITTPINAATR